jgi:hypothetical protein
MEMRISLGNIDMNDLADWLRRARALRDKANG